MNEPYIGIINKNTIIYDFNNLNKNGKIPRKNIRIIK